MYSKEYEYKKLSHYLRLGILLENVVERALYHLLRKFNLSSKLSKRLIHRNNVVCRGSDFIVDLLRRIKLEAKNWNGSYYLTPSMYREEVQSRFNISRSDVGRSDRDIVKIVIISRLRCSERVRSLFRRDRIETVELGFQLLDYNESRDEYLILDCNDMSFKVRSRSEVVEDVVRLLLKCLLLVKMISIFIQQLLLKSLKKQSSSKLQSPLLLESHFPDLDYG